VGLFGGDGGPATSANLHNPTGVAVFTNLLYIADNQNNRVRMVNLTSGIITTVAGTGAAGSGGDGGLATLAQLNGPYGVAVDAAGDLFIADTNNNRIREVNTAGTISTVAGNGTVGNGGDGGPATSAQLYHPMGVALDSLGDIYIADTDNQKIRKVIGGTISTVAGTGRVGYSCADGTATSVGLHSPSGVANYNAIAGAFAMADTGNQCVRYVTPPNVVNTVGNGIASFAGDGKLFNDPSVELNYPTGVAVDQGTGNVYIADTVNNRIRFVNSALIITTLAGTGIAGFSGDGGPAASAQLYNPTGVAVVPVGPYRAQGCASA
jgi:hypothetical protein